MKPIIMVVLVAASLLAGALAYGATAEPIGIVKSTVGEVVVTRGGRTVVATPNLKLYEGDVVQTGANGKAGLILEDDTVIAMGLNSRLAVEKFSFQPSEKKLSFLARIFRGTVSFLSGQIAKLAPDRVHIETPYATVGVRGTHALIRVD